MKTKTSVFGLAAVFVGSAVSVLADEGPQPIFVGSDGSVRFGNPVEYTSTGLSATAEALKYPEAVKQLIAEGRDFLPVKTKGAKGKMIGFITWRVVKETELGLAQSGDVLEVRPPASEAEKGREEKEITNPFGLLAVSFFVLFLMGNLMISRQEDNLFSAAFAAFVVAAAVAADDIGLYRVSSGVAVILMAAAVLAAI